MSLSVNTKRPTRLTVRSFRAANTAREPRPAFRSAQLKTQNAPLTIKTPTCFATMSDTHRPPIISPTRAHHAAEPPRRCHGTAPRHVVLLNDQQRTCRPAARPRTPTAALHSRPRRASKRQKTGAEADTSNQVPVTGHVRAPLHVRRVAVLHVRAGGRRGGAGGLDGRPIGPAGTHSRRPRGRAPNAT